VAGYDHHCHFWLGNCVGAGNRAAFVAFLACQAALLAVAAHNCVDAFHLRDHWSRGHTALAAAGAAFGLALAAVGGLLALQLALLAAGETMHSAFGRAALAAPRREAGKQRGCHGAQAATGVLAAALTPVFRILGLGGADDAAGGAARAAAALCDNPHYSCF